MTTPRCGPLVDVAPRERQFAAHVIAGLRRQRKQLSPKFFYDREGSELFEQICEQPEYYLTRSELAIMRRYAADMAAALGPSCMLVEYGSGSSLKTDMLLAKLTDPTGYVPIDISREQLAEAARRLAARHPGLEVLPVCADYTRDLTLPRASRRWSRTVVYFPGSTIGNFPPAAARRFLVRTRKVAGKHGGLLIGVDLKKDPRVLHAAYNDAAGITARFNRNMLERINRELGGSFRVDRFEHYAFYNPRAGRIEMHLVSLDEQIVRVSGQLFHFRQGESIFTESSYKYTLDEFEQLAADAGYAVERIWLDDARLMSVQYLVPA